jgi:hypothetical protein
MGEREQGSEEERGKEGAVRGIAACLQGISLASRVASRRCRRLGPAQDTQVLEVEDKGYFSENPGFGRFSRKKQNSTLLYYLVIQTTLKFFSK